VVTGQRVEGLGLRFRFRIQGLKVSFLEYGFKGSRALGARGQGSGVRVLRKGFGFLVWIPG